MTNPVQVASAVSGFGSLTQTVNFGSTPTIGDSIIVAITFQFGSIASGVTVTDNQTPANTYTLVKNNAPGTGGDETAIYFCSAVTHASGTFTVSASCSSGGVVSFGVIETSGAYTVDVDNINSSGSTNNITVTNGSANTSATDFVVALMAAQFTTSGPTGLANPTSGYTNFWIQDSNNAHNSCAGYKNESSIVTSSATWNWTVSQEASVIIATFAPPAPPANIVVAWLKC
jgi:hypothetical protein